MEPGIQQPNPYGDCDLTGRVDVLAVRLAEQFIRGHAPELSIYFAAARPLLDEWAEDFFDGVDVGPMLERMRAIEQAAPIRFSPQPHPMPPVQEGAR